jgi:hypothetical protein
LRRHNSPPIRPCWRSFAWSPVPFLPRHTVPLLLFSTVKLPRHSTPYSELGLTFERDRESTPVLSEKVHVVSCYLRSSVFTLSVFGAPWKKN